MHRWAVAALATVAFAAAVVVSATTFAGFSVNNDEPVYVFQSELIGQGRLTMPASRDSEFFRPWMSGRVDDRLIMVFPPVFPAVLALARQLTGTPRTALGLLAAAGVLLAYVLAREQTGDRRAGLCAAALLALAPLFVIQSALYLSYVLALDLELAAAALVVIGLKRSQRWPLLAAGACVGLLFFARPLDALLFTAPLVVLCAVTRGRAPAPSTAAIAPEPAAVGAAATTTPDAAVTRTADAEPAAVAQTGDVPQTGADAQTAAPWTDADNGRRLRGAVARTLLLTVGALPFVAMSLAYNAAVSGNPWRLPLDAIGGDNRPGFGLRRLSTGTPAVHYSFERAVDATVKNITALAGWLPGGALAIVLAGVGVWHLRRQRSTWALVAPVLLFPLGYLFYWGTLLIVAGRRSIGPHYYLAVLIPTVVFAGYELAKLWRRPLVGGGLVCVIALTSVVSVRARLDINDRQVALHRAERALLAKAKLDNALVILPAEQPDGAWIGHPRPSFLNDPDLARPVLFASDHGGENLRLLEDFPGRRLYRQFSRMGSHRGPTPVLWKLSSLSAETLQVSQHIENADGSPVVTVDVSDARGRVSYLLDAHSTKGKHYDVAWTVSSKGAVLVSPPAVPLRSRLVANPAASGTLVFGAGFGMSTDRDNQSRVEERYWYRVKAGTVSVMLPGEQWQHPVGPRRRWTDRDVADYGVTLQPF